MGRIAKDRETIKAHLATGHVYSTRYLAGTYGLPVASVRRILGELKKLGVVEKMGTGWRAVTATV